MNETNRRREKQEAYNTEHGITPETISKDIVDILASIYEKDYVDVPLRDTKPLVTQLSRLDPGGMRKEVEGMKKEMFRLARDLEFEKAAELRDRIEAAEEYLGTIVSSSSG